MAAFPPANPAIRAHLAASPPTYTRPFGHLWPRPGCVLTCLRQLDRERAAFALSRLHADRAPVTLDHPPRDGEPKPAARIAPLKPLEQARKPVRLDPRPAVDHVERRPRRPARHSP